MSLFNDNLKNIMDLLTLVSEYKDLLKIEDSEFFYKKIYEKVKNDYGYADVDTPIVFSNESLGSATAAWIVDRGEIRIYRRLTNKLDEQAKKNLIREALHEFHHVKQAEISYRTSVEKLLDIFEEGYPKAVINTILSFPEDKQKWFAEKVLNMSLDDMLKTLRNEASKDKPDVEFILNKTKWSFKRNNIRNNLDRIFGKMPKYTENSKEYKR